MVRKMRRNNRGFHRNILRLTAMLCLTAALTAAPAGTAFCGENLDPAQKTELTLDYHYNETPLPSAQFRLYRTADISDTVEFTLSGSFKDYPVKVNGLDNDGWKAAASTLAAYVSADRIGAQAEAETDAAGHLVFDSLEPGLYLVIGQKISRQGSVYESSPFLVSLPGLDAGRWEYEVGVNPKCSMKPETPDTPDTPDTPNTPDSPGGGGGNDGGPEKIKKTVIKVWNDEGARSGRPGSIKAVLLRDSEEYQTVTLNSANHWRHTWSGLSDEHDWEVIEEDAGDGYTVTYTDDDAIFTITNTSEEEITENPVPLGWLEIPDGSVPLGNLEELPDAPVPLAKLPQTGLLWWPVPLLAIAGMILFGAGWTGYYRKRDKKNEK